jgi:hypothetical protein
MLALTTTQYSPPSYADTPWPSVELNGIYKKISETLPHEKILYQSRGAALLFQVFYGFGVTIDVLDKYAVKSGIKSPTDHFSTSHGTRIANRLSYICDELLEFVIVVSDEHRYALALYDNYKASERKLLPEDEKEVLAIIKEELEYEGMFMWFHPLD